MASYDFYISNKELNKQTKESLHGSWKTASAVGAIALILCLIPIAVTVIVSVFTFWWLAIPLGFVCLLWIAIIGYGLNNFCHKIAKQEMPTKKELFAGFSKRIKDILSVAIKKFFLSIMWLVLLIFPFVVKNIGYSMSTLLMVDKKEIKSGNAIKESKHLMKQNYGRYAKFLLKNIHWFLLTLATGFIAWIWVGPLMLTKKAVFYENLKTDF